MAASRNPSREFGDRRNQQNYYDRNRYFSSTTTDHFRHKLSQIGIEKDLRELLERKRLQKDQDKNFPNTCSYDNVQKTERKVRFDEETSLRRSKSFTSDSTKSRENNYQGQKPPYNRFLKEHNLELPQSVHKNYRIKKFDFVDLHHPTNIKIEIRTDTGARKYTVDSNVPIPDIKCDIKKSRTVLKHAEHKEQLAPHQADESARKNENARGSPHFRGNFRRSFNKKNKENKKQSSSQNDKEHNDSAVENVVEALTNIAITDESEK